MTVTTTTASQTFQGNSTATAFPCQFEIFEDTDIDVYFVNPTTGTQIPAVLNSDYTVSGAGASSGFTVNTTVPVPTGTNLYVVRALPLTQPTDFTNQGAFFPTLHEAAFDRLCMLIQQIANYSEGLNITMAPGLVPQPSTLFPIPQPGSLIGWSNTGGALTNIAAPDAGTGTYAPSFPDSLPTRLVAGRLRERPSVFDFNAAGDGVTDDHDALSNAAASVSVVRLPRGTYRIASALTLSVPLVAEPGALIKPDSGVTVMITGAVTADDYQVFDCSAGGSFACSGSALAILAAWFGLSAAGTAASNTTAFTNAVAACPGQYSAQILLPAGVIQVNTLAVTKGGISVVGHDAGTWLVNNTTNAPAISVNSTSGTIYFCAIRNLKVGQASGVTPVAGNCGVYVGAGLDELNLEDVQCANYPAPLQDGFVFDGCNDVHMARLFVASLNGNGFTFQNAAGSCSGADLYSYNNLGSGFVFNGLSGFFGSHLHAYGNSTYGFTFPAAAANTYVYGENWWGDTSGSVNWDIEALQDSTFTNVWGCTQKSPSVNTFATGFYLTGAVNNVSFTGGHAMFNNSHGVQIRAGVTNVSFANFSAGSTSHPNGRSGGAADGFHIETPTHVTITGSRAHSNPGYGLNVIAGASDYLVVIGNDLSSNTTGSISNSSTGTHNQVANNAI